MSQTNSPDKCQGVDSAAGRRVYVRDAVIKLMRPLEVQKRSKSKPEEACKIVKQKGDGEDARGSVAS